MKKEIVEMDSKTLTRAVKQAALDEGADLVGIASIARYAHAPRMLRPGAHLPEAQSVIAMAIHHPDASVEWGGEPNSNFPGPFQIGMIAKLDTMAFRVARFIERQGYVAVPYSCTYYWRHRPYKDIPYAHAASFSNMNAFVAAGLGEYGWHGMVMSPKYGPRQRIISVITSAPLEPDPLYRGEPLCDRCMLCELACYGENYKPEHLLRPETIAFEIEGKKFEYANINRWRCFWGEQCRLDITKLAAVKNLDEQKIYDAMDSGIQRVSSGPAGYMCASFKQCMAKPVRRWDKKTSPGPLRKKAALPSKAPEDLRANILARARAAGTDLVAIQPLASFESLKKNFYEGFRTEPLFSTFKWVVTVGRRLPEEFLMANPLVQKNRHFGSAITKGRTTMGVIDIARYLDDLGYEAMQAWDATGIADHAARLAGWRTAEDDSLFVDSLLTTAPLEPDALSTALPSADIAPGQLLSDAPRVFPQIDLIAGVRLADLEFPEAENVKKALPFGKTLLAIGVELPKRLVELAGLQEAECSTSFQYVNYQTTREAYWAASDIASALSAQGYAALPLLDMVLESTGRDTPYVGTLTDLRAQSLFAAAAGLGSLGKNGMLVTKEFGQRVRCAFVVTSAELPVAALPPAASPCPDGCSACASACPMGALETVRTVIIKLSAGREFPVYERHEDKCLWARVLGMVEGEGTAQSGWRVPNLAFPGKLDEDTIKAALEQKDPIQRRCYQNPNRSDSQVERCLQACPL